MSKDEKRRQLKALYALLCESVEKARDFVTEYDRIFEKIFESEMPLRPRCVTTRELHLNMAESAGISLEELQTRCDLNKITISGTAIEIVKLKPQL